MDDLISRAEAISAINGWDWQDLYLPIHFKQVLEELPTVDTVRHGKWDKVKHYDDVFSCSYCGELTTETVMGTPRFNFCPMCGAKMDG